MAGNFCHISCVPFLAAVQLRNDGWSRIVSGLSEEAQPYGISI